MWWAGQVAERKGPESPAPSGSGDAKAENQVCGGCRHGRCSDDLPQRYRRRQATSTSDPIEKKRCQWHRKQEKRTRFRRRENRAAKRVVVVVACGKCHRGNVDCVIQYPDELCRRIDRDGPDQGVRGVVCRHCDRFERRESINVTAETAHAPGGKGKRDRIRTPTLEQNEIEIALFRKP